MIKIGLVGCGGIAHAHATAFRHAGQGCAQLYAVSRQLERAREFMEPLGAAGAIAPYEPALENGELDAVALLTPHDQHTGQASVALRSGKHVLIEKPVVRTVDEARSIAEAHADQSGCVLMVAENFHYTPALRHAREMIAQGAVGEIQNITAHGIGCNRPTGWRTQLEPMGGGALVDGGIHAIHGLRMLGGEVASVFAQSPAVKWNAMQGEESIQLLARMKSGATATVHISWSNHGNPRQPDFLVLGTAGSLAVYLGRRFNLLWRPGQGPQRQSTAPAGPLDMHVRYGYTPMAADFLHCIQQGATPQMTLAEGLRDLAVVQAAYRSAQTNQNEPVAPLPGWAKEV